jgi:hypothetical protein
MLSWVLTTSAIGEILTWNRNRLEIIDFYKLKEIIPDFKGQVSQMVTSQNYIICS